MTHHNLANNIMREDSRPECPLCMESLELDDINFYPCECGYQVCRFCWHRIRTDENGLCPACRKAYSENPAEYTPLSQEQLQKLKEVKKQRSVEKRHKVIESRKSLTNVRVVQKNLVFVIGLSPRLADPEILKKQEYFGKFGKIYRVVINSSTIYTGSQGNSLGAYITFYRSEDATKAIQAVNNAYIDGRCLKASLGTTKYCSHFLAGLTCPKSDCLFLHELGEEEASFTKEDMQLGKHQTYESITLAQAANAVVTKEQDKQPKKPPLVSQKSKEFDGGCDTAQQLTSESALPATAHWASQSNKIVDIPKPITTVTNSNTALSPLNEESNIYSVTYNSSTSNSSISEAMGIVEDLSSVTINSGSDSNVTMVTSGAAGSNSELNSDHRKMGHNKQSEMHKCSSDDGNKPVIDNVMLEVHGNDDSNNFTSKCPHQQQNHSKENVTVPHKGQHQQTKYGGGKGSKKSKDKKNNNVSHEKLKQTGGGGPRNVVAVTDSTVSNSFNNKVDNSPTKPVKENASKGGGGHGNTHNKKKKNKDNVVPTGTPMPHEGLTAVAKSESNFVAESRSSSTGMRAPPPGLTKQPSHTNAVNVLSQLAASKSNSYNWPDLSKLNGDDDELGFDPWSVSSKGFEDMLMPSQSTTKKSAVGTTNIERHTMPMTNKSFDAQRQAAAAYANYGPTAEDQLHQLQYQRKHQPMQYNHNPVTSGSMEDQLRALLPGINIRFDATTHYQSTHPNINYSSSYYTPTQAMTQSIPMMLHPPPVHPSAALPSHRNIPPPPPPPQAVTTTSCNSRNVIASPFDIPSLGCVTTTSHSSWPDLMSNSYNGMTSSSVKNNTSINNSSTSSRVTRPVSSLPTHQPPLVFPSNPEPFQDSGRFNYPPSLTNATTGNKAKSQANSEHNKGEYKLWSDSNSFGTDYNFFSSHATEFHQNIIKEMHGTKEGSQKSSSSWLDLCSNGDYSIPPTGLEFHNTQLLPNSPSQHSAAVNAPVLSQVPQSTREQELARQKEMEKFANNQSSSIGSNVPLNKSSVIGSQDNRGYKRHSYSGNSSTQYYTAPHYSQLAAAASSNYNRNTGRYSYYQQHHHT